MSEREPYEKPEVTTIDLGNLIDEAELQIANAVTQASDFSRKAAGLLDQAQDLQGDIALLQSVLTEVKRKHLVAQTALELREEAKKG